MLKKNTLLFGAAALLLLLIAFFWYQQPEKHLQKKRSKAYNRILENTENERKRLQNLYKQGYTAQAQEQAQSFLLTNLTQEIFPAWYGTTWDFNGTTETPLQGKIACGYFISTTLLHAGFQVERFKLAQQSATIIINTLCLKNSVQKFNSLDKTLDFMNEQPEGLYLVGLDTHIGFLEKKAEVLDFIHASRNRGVIREVAQNSPTLQSSKIFVIGNLLANPTLVEAWLTEQAIKVAE